MKAGALALALAVLGGMEARAAEIRDLAATLDGPRVLVSLRLAGAFDEALVARVESGLPTTLRYDFELLGDRKRWLDRGIEGSSLTVVGMYDAVRREYLINFKLDGRLLESRVVHDLAELERAMTRLEGVPAFALGEEDGHRLLVRARAELGYRHLLGFIPTRVLTEWAESRKFRPPPDPGR